MIGRIYSVVLDCPDPSALAEFYTALTGLRRTKDRPDWVSIGDHEGYRLSFQRAPDHVPPAWPDPARPQQAHLDVLVGADELDTAEAEVLKLGATRLPGEGDDFRVYADPAGHPFCLVWE